MKLNPKKCKEMLINFMYNNNFAIRPIVLGNNTVERVTTYKLLGILLSVMILSGASILITYQKKPRSACIP